jgi:hypothetical protein
VTDARMEIFIQKARVGRGFVTPPFARATSRAIATVPMMPMSTIVG